ncbi:MAG: hypothetical protein WBN69_05085 [Eudoraea sp.]
MLYKIKYLIIIVFLWHCKGPSEKAKTEWKSIEVTATAYNSIKNQTSDTPKIAAWGDSLESGMKCIAVSRDLLSLGIKHNTKVKISGLNGIYLVKDKMNKKWEKKIDIYMGEDIKLAKDWGSKKVTLTYELSEE